MRIYAIQRKADKKIVFSSASRRVIFDRFNKYHDRENYRIVILERVNMTEVMFWLLFLGLNFILFLCIMFLAYLLTH